jgi:anti-sigma28 factor (negative regulator of flagellin synthesis)
VKALAAALLVLGAFPLHAQMVKCVDARGVVHYTDKPLPGCKGGEVNIQGQPPISGKLQPRSPDPAREEREFQRRRIEGERQAKGEEREREARRRRCAALQAQLQGLESQRRVVTVSPQGERTFLDDGVRQQRIEQLRSEIARGCS